MRDLNEADDLIVRVISCEEVYSLDLFKVSEGDWLREHLNAHPRTVMRTLNFYRCAFGPTSRWQQPRNSDLGVRHLAFFVDDLDATVEHLLANGIRVLREPTASTNASEWQRWVYFLSPWGSQFELVSFPNGKPTKHIPT